MYVVTVVFKIKQPHLAMFMDAMRQQAADSLQLEAECLIFDVCQKITEPETIFLYEIYSSAEAFQHHLASPHFASFSEKIATWVASKTVDSFTKLSVGL